MVRRRPRLFVGVVTQLAHVPDPRGARGDRNWTPSKASRSQAVVYRAWSAAKDYGAASKAASPTFHLVCLDGGREQSLCHPRASRRQKARLRGQQTGVQQREEFADGQGAVARPRSGA